MDNLTEENENVRTYKTNRDNKKQKISMYKLRPDFIGQASAWPSKGNELKWDLNLTPEAATILKN